MCLWKKGGVWEGHDELEAYVNWFKYHSTREPDITVARYLEMVLLKTFILSFDGTAKICSWQKNLEVDMEQASDKKNNSKNESAINLKWLEHFLDLVKAYPYSEFELRNSEIHIRLKRENELEGTLDNPAVPMPIVQDETSSLSAITEQPPSGCEIKSPMVGVFCCASRRGENIKILPGLAVGPETVIGYIKALKLWHPVKAQVHGYIKACLVMDGQIVQYGQPLFYIEPRYYQDGLDNHV